MTALATFRTKVRAKLNDPDGDRFTDEQIDSALRDALSEDDSRRPYALTGDITANGERDIPCTAITDTILKIFKAVWDDGSDEGDNLAFYATVRDGDNYITVNKDIPSGDTITLHYTRPHTIEDFDSATETTVWDESLLALAAAGYALLARAVSAAESNNLNPSTAKTLTEAGNLKLQIFRTQLSGDSGSGYAVWK